MNASPAQKTRVLGDFMTGFIAKSCAKSRRLIGAGVLLATCSAATIAQAGGFAVREQSTTLLGVAFAGAAAGVDLSSAYWNPAAFSIAQPGLSTQSSYTAIFADTELTGVPTAGGVPFAAPDSTNIDKIGVLSATNAAYRISDKVVFGVNINAPFGLATEADNEAYNGRFQGYAASMITLNVNPSASYEVMPGLSVGAGLQIEYMQLKLWQAAALGGAPPALVETNTSIKAEDDAAVGFTLGAMWRPVAGTSVGVGFRSSMVHELEGKFNLPVLPTRIPTKAKLETPEILTVSLMQSLAPNIRVMGTFEWTNWSRVDVVSVPLGILGNGELDANWEDGYFVSGGLEYDMNNQFTLRGGVAWEKSPIREASQRLIVLPDTDRVWLSAGVSYRYSDSTTLDLGYSHIFFEDGDVSRGTLRPSPLRYEGSVENSADIISLGMRTRW